MAETKPADQQLMQTMNRGLVFRTIVNYSPVSRSEVARMTTLSPSAVANAVAVLIQDGLVLEVGVGVSQKRGGRRPILLDVMWDARQALSVALSDRGLSIALINMHLDVLWRGFRSLEKGQNVNAVIDGAIAEVLSMRPKLDGTIVGIGISSPGILDRNRLEIMSAASYSWRDVVLSDLQTKYGLPITLENDMNAAAVGEQSRGVAREVDSFAYVLVDSGVGAGVIENRRVMLGHNGWAGEFGHTTVDWNGEPCLCGSKGCLEQYIKWSRMSLTLSKILKRPITEFDDRARVMKEGLQSGSLFNKEVRRSAELLAAGLTSLVNLIDPQLIVLDSFFNHVPEFTDWVQAGLLSRLSNLRNDSIPAVVRSGLGDVAPLIGVASMVFDKADVVSYSGVRAQLHDSSI
ncbi:MAG: ROK family protein [Bacilli bacterium]